jgi:hypothetical protein
MITRHVALVGVELFEVSNNFMYKLSQNRPMPYQIFNVLPKYTINTNETAKNKMVLAEEFLQFVGTFKSDHGNPKYLMFNFNTLDSLLNEEMGQGGVEELFKEFDFKQVLSHFTPQKEEDLEQFVFPHVNYLVVELHYDGGFDHEGNYDCDMHVEITGYLNDIMELTKFNLNIVQ